MEELRTVGCLGKPEKVDAEAPFSNFEFVEDRFGLQDNGCRHLKRLLSQARVLDYRTIIIEDIESVGLSRDDDKDLEEAGYELSDKKLVRLTLFKKSIASIDNIEELTDDDFVGYVILKQYNGPRNLDHKWQKVRYNLTKPGGPNEKDVQQRVQGQGGTGSAEG